MRGGSGEGLFGVECAWDGGLWHEGSVYKVLVLYWSWRGDLG